MLTNNFFKFLKELSKNNNKDRFDIHRQRYEVDVKKPFEVFVQELGNSLSQFDSEIQGDFKKNISRINKGIRCFKDKAPYKTNRSVAYSLNGKKDHQDPGYYTNVIFKICQFFKNLTVVNADGIKIIGQLGAADIGQYILSFRYYFELGAEKSYVAGGAWSPSPEKLLKIRSEIFYNTEEFHHNLKNKKFKDTFQDIQGERSKVLPKDIKEWVKDSEYILNKQFYFWKKFDNKHLLEKDFIKKSTKNFMHGFEVNPFLRKAMRD